MWHRCASNRSDGALLTRRAFDDVALIAGRLESSTEGS
jgi:hypothetical protein